MGDTSTPRATQTANMTQSQRNRMATRAERRNALRRARGTDARGMLEAARRLNARNR